MKKPAIWIRLSGRSVVAVALLFGLFASTAMAVTFTVDIPYTTRTPSDPLPLLMEIQLPVNPYITGDATFTLCMAGNFNCDYEWVEVFLDGPGPYNVPSSSPFPTYPGPYLEPSAYSDPGAYPGGLYLGRVFNADTTDDVFDFAGNDSPDSSSQMKPFYTGSATIPQADLAPLLQDGSLTLRLFSPWTVNVQWALGCDSSLSYEAEPVPDAGTTLILLGIGITGLLGLRKRRL